MRSLFGESNASQRTVQQRGLVAIVLLVGLLLSTTLGAQVPTGTITGKAASENGDGLPGVTVVATSDRPAGRGASP